MNRRPTRSSGRRRFVAVAAIAAIAIGGVTGAAVATGAIAISDGAGSNLSAPMRAEAGGAVDQGAPSASDSIAKRSLVAVPSVLPAPAAATRGDSAPSAPIATPSELVDLAAATIIPVAGVTASQLVDSFDDRRGASGANPSGPRRHDALDILAPRGTPVVSATAGQLLKLFDSKTGGLMVYAADASARFVLLYGHLDRYAPGLREGAALQRGQTIGYVGTTGNAAPETPHLHFGIARSGDVSQWWEGTPVNPYPLLQPR